MTNQLEVFDLYPFELIKSPIVMNSDSFNLTQTINIKWEIEKLKDADSEFVFEELVNKLRELILNK